MRIVYVEDNLANVHLVKRVARMGQHEVINYIDGMDAFNNFASDHPDLVLMDIQLAGELTGIEVVQKLRAKGFTTPIIAVTAYAMVGDKERCIEAGCTDYMSKPIPVTELVKLFQEYNQQITESKQSKTTTNESETSTSTAQPVQAELTEKTSNTSAELSKSTSKDEHQPNDEEEKPDSTDGKPLDKIVDDTANEGKDKVSAETYSAQTASKQEVQLKPTKDNQQAEMQ